MVPIRLPFAPIILLLVILSDTACPCLAVASDQELLKGFSATPLSSVTSFQPILSDQFGNFSLGFLRLNRTQLALAVLHIASSEPLWFANPTHLASWSQSTRLFFNGSLVISDPVTDFLWSTATNGDRVVLLNTSNLQVQKNGESGSVIWQSFDFPTNTIVQDQNFTARMALVSSNGLYSLRMGDDFMGLYARHRGGSDELYWKHNPLEAKAEIVEGKGPIYARISSDGYLGMYQTGTKPVDVQKFNNFQRPNPLFLMLRIEPDGNLKGYCWDGSTWVLNYQAIEEICELPNPCGPYGLCTPGASGCSCLDNRTSYSPGGCMKEGYGDLCGAGIGEDKYWVLRRKGVEPAHKELMRYERATSEEECEDMCKKDCRCWGALYYNVTGYCYVSEHPIQTMVGTGAESKVGYFKVRKDAGDQRKRVGTVVGIVAGVVIVAGLIGAVSCVMRRKRRRGGKGMAEEEDRVISGPYKNLESASFRSIEMSTSH
ncbi:PAN domain-containing protein At5g03700-like [Neltuma alba]|uniref:PAN domain-containing protein At5g03700-like n=1 Tax=Neltuma alba TaxID=207710 RepID=UPI0010A5438A|nr:PAN domain-containing protein At5g03700-like [Prosopis alba]